MNCKNPNRQKNHRLTYFHDTRITNYISGCCAFEMMTRRHAFNARDINSLAMKVLCGKSPKMPDAYTKNLTSLIARMLSFESENRPSVTNILQQRFIRDRIKIFLNKQRPRSGKSRKSVSPKPKTPDKIVIESEQEGHQ
jgi:serine/threonine protein kinase